MKKILVGVDGSPESRKAAEQASDLAASTGAEILLASVVALPVPVGPEPGYLESLEFVEREHARALLGQLSSACRARGLRVHTVMPSGSPAEQLANIASTPDIDLV